MKKSERLNNILIEAKRILLKNLNFSENQFRKYTTNENLISLHNAALVLKRDVIDQVFQESMNFYFFAIVINGFQLISYDRHRPQNSIKA